jgi:hypothetical protein
MSLLEAAMNRGLASQGLSAAFPDFRRFGVPMWQRQLSRTQGRRNGIL